MKKGKDRRDNPHGKIGRKHLRAPQTQALSQGLGLVLTLKPTPSGTGLTREADVGTGGQVKAYHLR